MNKSNAMKKILPIMLSAAVFIGEFHGAALSVSASKVLETELIEAETDVELPDGADSSLQEEIEFEPEVEAIENEEPEEAVEDSLMEDTNEQQTLKESNAPMEEVESTDAADEAATEVEAEAFTEERAQFLEIINDHDVIGLIYNCDSYDVKEEADSSASNVSNLAIGSSIQFLDVSFHNNKVWYYVQFAVNDTVLYGYVENDNVITSDMYFTEWKETYNIDNLFSRARSLTRTTSTNLAAFPESYRPYIQSLINAHPNWTFVPFNTGLNWNTVISNEMYPTRNLVPVNSMTSWKSMDAPHYDPATGQWVTYDSGNWVQGSESIVKYYMDPRNFLNETSVFQFELLTYSANHTESGVEALLSNTFMSKKKLEDGSGDGKTYAKVFMEIGASLKVSPYFLAGRVRQEQGVNGTSKLISGTYPGYEGLYNYFNMGASGNSTEQIIANGLTEARNEGWTSRYLALQGGSAKVAQKYIQRGQDTLYLQKFDVDGSYDGLYWHQYMQNLLAADNEGKSTRNAYSNMGALNNGFVFKVPVYNNMPTSAYAMPKDTLKKPVVSVNKNSMTSSTISWDEVSGAAGYKIYRASSSNGTYTLVKTNKGIGTTSYTVNIKAGTTYYYKVRAYMTDPVLGKTIYSSYSTAKAVDTTVPKATLNSATVNSSGYVTLKWGKVSGITGYRIYRKTGSSGKYTSIQTIKGNSTVTFTDKRVVPNQTYYYKVRVYQTASGKNYYAASSNAKKAVTTVTVPTITSGKYSSNVVIKWNKVSGATGYRVYRKTGASGKYGSIATIKSNSTVSFTDKKAVPNKTYYYKVRVYKTVGGKNYYSSSSKAQKVSTTVSTASISSVKKNSSTSVKLTWKSVSGSTGYRIYRKTGSSGKYDSIQTIKSNKTLTFTDKKVKSNRTYYYKVRVYKTVGSKNYYSASSVGKKITL